MTKFKPPLTEDGKWRLSTMEAWLRIPNLPYRVDVVEDHANVPDEINLADNEVWLVSTNNNSFEIEERAPRLSEAVYRYRRTGDHRWYILWRYSATWKEKGLRAIAYRPIIRIKAGKSNERY